MKNFTEQNSLYDGLEDMSAGDLLRSINGEDAKVHEAVRSAIPQIETLVEQIVPRMKNGGRMFYIGAGTSGRLGILDASEMPPTYGVPAGMVVGIIAGGDTAIRKAVEGAEDDTSLAWQNLSAHDINELDTVIGIAASGTTPYVLGGINEARSRGILTGGITCNPGSPLALTAEYPVEVVTGPEFVTGSTRMKAGTAQKMVLNMISTTVMIKLGRVKGNKMVNMQLTNKKLVARGTRMISEESGLSENEARELLLKYGSVKEALKAVNDK